MNDHFGAGFARAVCRLISRAVIDDKNVVEFPARSANDVADMILLVVSRNDRCSSRRLYPPRPRHDSPFERRNTWSEFRCLARERTTGVGRSTVSMLWL